MKTLLLLTLLCSCATTQPSPTPVPAGATCSDVCQHGTWLGCPWAFPTPNGGTCREVCENAQTLVTWNLQCRATADSCGAIDLCETR